MRRRSARPEDQIQRAVVQHYRQRAAPGVFMFAVPNGGKRRPIEAAIMKSTGTVAGVPDTIWIKEGMVYAIEIKTEDGRPTESQLKAIEDIRNAGGHACICYGLDRTLACLETWGLLVGKAA